jgi:alpha-L-rhamnosidase
VSTDAAIAVPAAIADGSAPTSLQIDSGGDQFPVSTAAPRLSWRLPSGWSKQGGYELDYRVDGTPHRFVGMGEQHRYVAWPDDPLTSGQSVAWRVRVTGDGAASAWSDWHAFECGLRDADWTAGWISPAETDPEAAQSHPAYRLSTAFDVPEVPVRARLYATAHGVYEAFVNGERAGASELAPGATSYDLTLYAQASDVTHSLQRGENTLSFLVSDGWYRGKVGAFRDRAWWGPQLAVRAELHLVFADRSARIIRTDESWAAGVSEISRADLMDGQVTDFTTGSAPMEPVRPSADPVTPITWSPAPPVRRIESRAPVASWRQPDGSWVVDFGQNASGWVRATNLGAAGTRTTCDFGEFVDRDGNLSTTHLDSHRQDEVRRFEQRDEVVSSGAAGEVFEPRHTVHGFRYVRVERSDGGFDPASVVMEIVHSDLAPAGSFACSDDDLTKLHDIAVWSFRGNAVDIPTDCPTRERLGWTGDYQVFAPTAVRLFDVSGFTRKWLQSVRDDQLPDGRIANFSPDARRNKVQDGPLSALTGSAGWGDAIVAVPRTMYETYGDVQVLVENWDAMTRWVEWAAETARTKRHPSRVERSAEPAPHEQYLWDGSFHWGEWLEPMERDADGELINPLTTNPMAWFGADKGEVGTAYLVRSAATVAHVAGIVGRDAEAQRFAELADRARDAWRMEFLREDGRTVTDTQAAYVRALSFGLVPDELRSASAARLVELVRDAGTHLRTGFLSTADLLPVLVTTGYPDVAYELLLQRTSPSWLAMIDRGATTVWEDWDGIDERGDAHESLNHYSKGAVVRFLHTHTLGLQQVDGSTAWEEFVVQPVPGGGLTWASGEFDSPQGRIAVDWRLMAGQLRVRVEVPGGSRARIVFPNGVEATAGPGVFEGAEPATTS